MSWRSPTCSRPGTYEAAQAGEGSRSRVIEEALRFEAPITGMPGRVTCPVNLGGTDLKPGDEVFLAYASGNRDPDCCERPEEFGVERTGSSSTSARPRPLISRFARLVKCSPSPPMRRYCRFSGDTAFMFNRPASKAFMVHARLASSKGKSCTAIQYSRKKGTLPAIPSWCAYRAVPGSGLFLSCNPINRTPWSSSEKEDDYGGT